MLDAIAFRELVNGSRRGLRATAMRSVLRTIEAPYTLAVNWRNRRYDEGKVAIHRVGVPVISVGNLTLGGTGKTPMVKWLARQLRDSGLRVVIVSRGYRAQSGQQNDESLELAAALPDVPHVQNRDRVAAAVRAIEHFNAEVVLLDDGFQHRRLARDLDIVLLDALEPFGFDHVFPRGTLREPLSGLRRAHVIGLSRADSISIAEREAIRRRVAEIAPQATCCELAHTASGLIDAAGQTQSLDALVGRRVAAFCGIGNPAGFRHTLATIGCQIIAWREFPDHHAYGPADLAEIREFCSGADVAVCTHKDLVKVRQQTMGRVPLWAVAIEMRILKGQDSVEHAFQRILPPSASAAR